MVSSIEPTVTIRVLYANRRRAYDDIHKLGLLDGPIYRTIAVHPDGVYIRVTAPQRIEREIRAILYWGEEIEALPDTSECSEFYQEEAITSFRGQRKRRRGP